MTSNPTKRIALIGPVVPYRGGIAQHTTMLHRALAKQADLLTISFSRQYPAWLFPSESDTDPAFDGHREPGVENLIDSLNPLTWRRCAEAIKEFEPDAVIIPWWTVYWTFCFHHIAALLKGSRMPLVFFCHNVIEHESAFWRRHLTKWVLDTANQFVVHTRTDRDNLVALLPHANVLVHPHPTYEQFPPAKGTLPRRAPLELLFFGFVRAYKGLDVLLEAIALLRERDLMLTIAGEFWSDSDQCTKTIRRLGIEQKVDVCPRYHTEQETAELFARADVVVLPYRSATGSGIVALAYRYGKPVIASNVGGLPDVVVPGETGVLVAPPSSQELAHAIGTFTADRASSMRAAVRSLAQSLTWEGLATTLIRSLAGSEE